MEIQVKTLENDEEYLRWISTEIDFEKTTTMDAQELYLSKGFTEENLKILKFEGDENE